MKTLTKNFFLFGIVGWCMEIIFTALHSFKRRDFTLTGNTSLWMFPIYGCGTFLIPLSKLIKKWHIAARGLFYAILIFTVEFFTGRLLWKRNSCPWDYSRSRWNISNVIRLDYTPFWICVGLFFEKIGKKQP
ncbi:MAG: hypothetical protein IJN54_09340 [Lachnospiraceae bacterium]|nr:hypothetical protein [Lachnospiraceae bacterium]